MLVFDRDLEADAPDTCVSQFATDPAKNVAADAAARLRANSRTVRQDGPLELQPTAVGRDNTRLLRRQLAMIMRR
jgi:hypothetical protein